jgi:hypothetical protein
MHMSHYQYSFYILLLLVGVSTLGFSLEPVCGSSAGSSPSSSWECFQKVRDPFVAPLLKKDILPRKQELSAEEQTNLQKQVEGCRHVRHWNCYQAFCCWLKTWRQSKLPKRSTAAEPRSLGVQQLDPQHAEAAVG